MPMNRKRYAKNWQDIALKVKYEADWTCQECGKKCLNRTQQMQIRVGQLVMSKSERAKRTLTVHHSDYNPSNNDPSNLIALCAPCHLAKHTRKTGNISQGQLQLFEVKSCKKPTKAKN